jgi:general secretion pathway protein K
MRLEDGEDNAALDESGFVLVTVIWGVGLVSLLALAFVLNVRTESRIASNALGTARLEAFADAGVNIAILDLLRAVKQPSSKERFAHNGQFVACRMSEDAVLKISVQDEEGKVDLNTAAEPLLLALIEGLNVSAGDVERYADSIIDFRDSDSLRRLNGAERRDYELAGKDWRPNDAPFHSVEELHSVLNLPPSLTGLLKRLVTVYSYRGGIDPSVAPSAVFKALSGRADLRAVSGQIPPAFSITSSRRFFAIRVEAIGGNGGRFVREVAVELRRGAEQPYQFRSWRRGKLGETASSDPTATQSEC